MVNEPFKSHLLSKVIPKKKWNEITEYIRLLILSLLQTFTSLWICTFTIATITRTFVCPGQVGTDLLTSTVAWSTFVNVCNFHKWNLTSDHARRLSFYWPLLYKRLTIQPGELCVCCCKSPVWKPDELSATCSLQFVIKDIRLEVLSVLCQSLYRCTKWCRSTICSFSVVFH